MVSLADAVLVLTQGANPPAVPGVDFDVLDLLDGNGLQLARWNARLGPQPGADQLAAVTQAQVDAVHQQQAQAVAQALLADPGGAGTALRAIFLAAGLTAAQVSAQLSAASQMKG